MKIDYRNEKPHHIAMPCISNSPSDRRQPHRTAEAAVGDLAVLLYLSEQRQRLLRRNWHLDLTKEEGCEVDYCEAVECDCDDPEKV